MIIGCVTLVPVGNINPKDFSRVAAIRCAKKRGVILPGGKWETGELFEEAAAREFVEETGSYLEDLPTLFWQGYTFHDNFTYCFLGTCLNYGACIKTDEGETLWARWSDLLTSEFRQYYSLLRQHCENVGLYTGDDFERHRPLDYRCRGC